MTFDTCHRLFCFLSTSSMCINWLREKECRGVCVFTYRYTCTSCSPYLTGRSMSTLHIFIERLLFGSAVIDAYCNLKESLCRLVLMHDLVWHERREKRRTVLLYYSSMITDFLSSSSRIILNDLNERKSDLITTSIVSITRISNEDEYQ